MGFFSKLLGGGDQKTTTSSSSTITPKNITSPFGGITGDKNALNIEPSQQLLGNYGLFGDIVSGAGQQYQALDSVGFENALLQRLRDMSRFDEEQQSSNLISNLFGSGKLGRSVYDEGGNLIQPELFNMQKALDQADLMRQVQALTEGRNMRNDLLGAATQGVNLQTGLFNQPLQLANLALSGGNTAGTTVSKQPSQSMLPLLASAALTAWNPMAGMAAGGLFGGGGSTGGIAGGASTPLSSLIPQTNGIYGMFPGYTG